MVLKSILITSEIKAHKDHDVATINSTGACLHTDNDKYVIMLLRGRLEEFMSNPDPKLYWKYGRTGGKGKTLLYVDVLKQLYGLLKSALLFYKKMVKDLESYWIKNNTYHPCVANPIMNGKQMNVTFYVDYLKVSNKDPFHITKFVYYIPSIYEK